MITLSKLLAAALALIALPLFGPLSSAYAQQSSEVIAGSSQVVKGRVLDADSKYPIPGAVISLVLQGSNIAKQTDDQGYFRLEGVPLGRQILRITSIGYGPRVIQNVLVTAGKEVVLDVTMEEMVTQSTTVEVVADNKNPRLAATEVKNEMSYVSGRGFNLEETMRYAGSRNDPSRMASNFAGVQINNDGRNDIIIRGNSPTGMLWRFEGLDIPNPSHFGAAGATGGPVSILNNNVLAKSDFFTGAFPAEFGNAYSGAFDLNMRQGNRDKYEFLGQVGFNGFEAGAEGPLGKSKIGSFLANYRYSTLGLVSRLGLNVGTGAAVPNYQDLTFKLSYDVGKSGRVEVFGMGGFSDIFFNGKEADTTSLYSGDRQDLTYRTSMGVIGANYIHFWSPKTYGKLTFGMSGNTVSAINDSLAGQDYSQKIKLYRDKTSTSRTSLRYNLSHKFSSQSTLNFGTMIDYQGFSFNDSVLTYLPPTGAGVPRQSYMRPLRTSDGSTMLYQAYGQFQYKFSDRLTANAGLHLQNISLNNQVAIEPRIGARYLLDDVSNISFGYGLHSQAQPLATYFRRTIATDGSTNLTNKDLKFTQSHHIVLGYNRVFGSHTRLRTEAYLQELYNAPVEARPTSYSMLNYGADFNYPDRDSLQSTGRGRTFGIEATLERTFSNGYYFLITTSVYDSRYQGSDNVWRNTAFNSNWLVNVLGGYEVKLSKTFVLAFDTKVTTGGGRYYTPFDVTASTIARSGIQDVGNAYGKRFEDYFRIDFKTTLRANVGRVTHEFFVDIQNITNRQNPFSKTWNTEKNRESTIPQLGLFPNVNYRVVF